jgi:hypothetical protein
MTLFELALSVAILVVGMLGYSHAISVTAGSANLAREQALATEAARAVAQTMHGTPFDEVFATFNLDGDDDPDGEGTAPGASFAVVGLTPVAGDADGFCGEVLFPTQDVGGLAALREDLVDPRFQTPRDLSGDGVIDGNDHSGDYRLLPALIRVAWRGEAGNSVLEFKTMIVEFD